MGFIFITGLDATESFFSRYGASLKELDFSIMTFLWNEKYGHKLNSIEGKQLDYFYEPTSLKEARCLIWLLEEHRDKFPALHNALDEFFDIMGMWAKFQFLSNSRGNISEGPRLFKNEENSENYHGATSLRIVIFFFFHIIIKPFCSIELSVRSSEGYVTRTVSITVVMLDILSPSWQRLHIKLIIF